METPHQSRFVRSSGILGLKNSVGQCGVERRYIPDFSFSFIPLYSKYPGYFPKKLRAGFLEFFPQVVEYLFVGFQTIGG